MIQWRPVFAGCFWARGPELLQLACYQPENEANSHRKQTQKTQRKAEPGPRWSCARSLPAFRASAALRDLLIISLEDTDTLHCPGSALSNPLSITQRSHPSKHKPDDTSICKDLDGFLLSIWRKYIHELNTIQALWGLVAHVNKYGL